MLQKVQKLQYVCRSACIAVPLDHLVARQSKLSTSLTEKYLGVAKQATELKVENPKVALKENDTAPIITKNVISVAGRTASALPSTPSITILSEEQRLNILPSKKLSPFSSSDVQGSTIPDEEEDSDSVDIAVGVPKVSIHKSSTSSDSSSSDASVEQLKRLSTVSANATQRKLFLILAIFAAILAWLSTRY